MLDESIRSLWTEPWTQAHASWLRTPSFEAARARLGEARAPALRFAQRMLFAAFELDAGPPLTTLDTERLRGLAFDADSIQRAALLIGMLSHVSFAASGSAALANRESREASSGDWAWQQAFKMARARPLRQAGYDGPHDATHDGLLVQGAFYLRASAEALQARLWPRLRTRFERRLVERQRCLVDRHAIGLDDATGRQVMRAWRMAGALPIESSTPMTPEDAFV